MNPRHGVGARRGADRGDPVLRVYVNVSVEASKMEEVNDSCTALERGRDIGHRKGASPTVTAERRAETSNQRRRHAEYKPVHSSVFCYR